MPLAADRERCRALLANVEFVQFLAAPPGSPFRSPLFRFMAWLIVSALPVGVFLAVQISFLRYQCEAITTLHQLCLALDLAALFWFHTRLWLAGRRREVIHAPAFRRRMALNFAVSLLVLAFAVVYAGVPSADKTVGARKIRVVSQVAKEYERTVASTWVPLIGAALQPLDLAACPWLGFGCRFHRLDNRTLLANSPPADVLNRLRTGASDDLKKDLAHVEGLFLRGRTLRFADFTESRLYAADLIDADLRGAELNHARLQGAALLFAELQGAELQSAKLRGASLFGARLQSADLSEAQLQGNLLFAAQLQSATLLGAQLQGANLSKAQLQGADLSEAQLQGADLFRAQLQGANLQGVQLKGADMRGVRLSQTAVNAETNLGLADLRGASWRPIDDDEEITQLRKELTPCRIG